MITSFKTVERPAALVGVEVHRGWAVPGVDAHRQFGPFAIAAMTGKVSYRYRGRSYDRVGEHLVLGEPGNFIACKVNDRVTFDHWWISEEIMRQAVDERGHRGALRFRQEGAASKPLVDAIGALATAHDALSLQELFAELLDLLLAHYVENPREIKDIVAPEAVLRMRSFLHENLDKPFNLDEIAKEARLNKSYAIRAFKRETGVSPSIYQRHLRLEKAREMLRSGLRVIDTALSLGFYDQSHFDRVFREAVLVSPREYQRGKSA